MIDAFRDAQKKELISVEKDAQAELDRLSVEIIKNMNFAVVLLSPKHVVPVFDSQYVQHQDRICAEFPSARYLVQDYKIERN